MGIYASSWSPTGLSQVASFIHYPWWSHWGDHKILSLSASSMLNAPKSPSLSCQVSQMIQCLDKIGTWTKSRRIISHHHEKQVMLVGRGQYIESCQTLQPSLYCPQVLSLSLARCVRELFYNSSGPKHLWLDRSLCHFLSRENLVTTAHPLITSRLDYYNTVWSCGHPESKASTLESCLSTKQNRPVGTHCASSSQNYISYLSRSESNSRFWVAKVPYLF